MSGGQLFALLDRAQNGDDEACEQVLLENSGLIWSIVRRYYGCGGRRTTCISWDALDSSKL